MTRPRPLRLIQDSGFPSSSRQLVKRIQKKNTNDPNGYYSILGVDPWATPQEIKKSYRFLARIVHPDGSEPDEEAFRLLQNIYDILSDPQLRELYNSTPKGYLYVSESEKELIFSGEGVVETVDPPPKPEPHVFKHWDYYVDEVDVPLERVQEWYNLLLLTAQSRGVECTIRLAFLNRLEKVWPPYGSMTMGDQFVLTIPPSLEPFWHYAFLLVDELVASVCVLQETLYTG